MIENRVLTSNEALVAYSILWITGKLTHALAKRPRTNKKHKFIKTLTLFKAPRRT